MRKGVDKALDTLKAPSERKTPEAVHDARKGFKRLRALLRLVQPTLGGKRFRREDRVFRDAGRALSGTRDAQVLMAAFDSLFKPRGQVSPGAAVRARSKLSHDCEGEAQVAAPLAGAPPVVPGLEAVRDRLHHAWPFKGNHWRHVGHGLRASFREGRWALRRLQARPDDDAAWHALRKRVKDLGYQLRALQPLWPRSLKGMGRDLNALGEALGDDHDLVVLRARLLEHPALGATLVDLDAFAAVVDHRRAALHARANTIGRRIYREKPGDFEDRLRSLWQVSQRKKRLARTSTEKTA